MKIGSFSRDVWAIILFSGVSSLSFGIFMTTWQLYLKSAGYTGEIIGLYNLISGLIMTVFVVPAGIIADKSGRRRFLFVGSLLFAASTILIVAFIGVSYLVCSALLSGLGWASIQPSINALMADKAGDRMDSAYSASSFASGICMAAGSLLGWIPETLVSKGWTYFKAYRLMTLLAGLVQLATFFIVFLIGEAKASCTRRISFGRIRANPILLRLFFLSTLIGFGAGLSIPLFSYYFSVKFGVESGPIGTLYMIINVAGSFLYLTAAPLSRRLGLLKGIVLPQAASVPLLALIPYSKSFVAASILYICRTGLMNMANPLIQALYMNISHPEDRATVTAFSSICWGLPNSVSSQIGGILMDKALDLPVLLTAAFYAAYVILFYFLLEEKQLKSNLNV